MIIGQRAKFVDYTATASSENAVYPATNLKLYNHPRRPLKTEVTTACNVVFDFGSTKSIAGIAVDWCNFASGSWQGHGSDSWADPDYDETITLAKNADLSKYILDSDSQRYGMTQLFHVPTAFNYRYARLVIDAQTPSNGADHFNIGRVIFLSAVTTMRQNPAYGFDWQVIEPVGVNPFQSGGTERVSFGVPKKTGSFAWSKIKSTYLSDIQTIASIPQHKLTVIYENYATDGSDFTVCFRNDPIPITWDNYNIMAVGAVNFEESI